MPSLRTIVLFATLFMVPYSIYAEEETPKPTPQPSPKPKLVEGPEIVITPAGATQELLTLRNDTDIDMTVSLRAVVTSTTNAGTRIKFKGEHEDTEKAEAAYATVVPRNGVIKVWAIVTDVTSVGEFEADLKNKEESIGTIKGTRLPFAVKLDETNPEKFSMVEGVPTSIALKNDDPASYRLIWRILVNGREVCQGKITLAASGLGILQCSPSVTFDPSRFQDLFKEQDVKGMSLLLYPQPLEGEPDKASPWKPIPIQAASLGYFGPFTRQAWSYLVIVIVLIVGGLASLVLSHALPNRLQKLNVREQLDEIARTTADLSSNIDSKLQVMLRVERSRLNDLLQSRTTISPDFASIAKQCSEATTKLGSRVALAQQMDTVFGRLGRVRAQSAPPTLIDDIEASLKKSNLLLIKGQPTDADLAAAQVAIVDASGRVDTLKQPDSNFGEKLKKRALEVKTDIDENLKDKSAAFTELDKSLPGPYRALERVSPAQDISSDRYASLDMAIEKILLMKEYVRLFEGTSDAEMLKRLLPREAALVQFLQLGSWEALRSARLLVLEMRDDIYPERFDLALQTQEASIDMDPNVAYDRAPLEFCICFQSAAVNTAAAREELTCNWDFGDGLKETGWNVSHYFQLRTSRQWADNQSTGTGTNGNNQSTETVKDSETKTNQTGTGGAKTKGGRSEYTTYPVTATFITAAGKPLTYTTTNLPVVLTKQVEVRPSSRKDIFGERSRTEGLKLGAALLIAVFGLIAGAQEQLLKLDILPALIAVFLLGFGADTIKNLLTTRSS